jgi:catechol 2,3-dioxygenase-like lactoylglutathione lyase family enzyme
MATIKPHHVGLTVGDIERAQRWYVDALGLEVVLEVVLEFALPGDVRGAMLRNDAGAGVELFGVLGAEAGVSHADPPAAMRTTGFGHVAFEVDDLDAAYAALLEAGASAVWEPRQAPEPGRRMAFVHDPDGNLIELIA